MPLELSHCVLADAPAFAESFTSTYERQPRHIAFYGGIPRDRQVEIYTKYFRDGIKLQDQPTPTQETHYLKVTDTATGELAAYAIWIFLPQGYKIEEDPYADTSHIPEGANERLIRDFGKWTGEMRGAHKGRQGPHWRKH